MAKEVMRRSASDNEYLHKDFHGALSVGLDYLAENYGRQAVEDYLKRFTLSFYAPLRQALQNKGLGALKEHFERLYKTEGGEVEFKLTDNELLISVAACPAVMHMRENSYSVSSLFSLTTSAVNEALCQDTPYAAELVEYDEQTGKSIQRFYRRKM